MTPILHPAPELHDALAQTFPWEAAPWVTGISLEQLRRAYLAHLPVGALPGALTMQEIHWLAEVAASNLSEED